MAFTSGTTTDIIIPELFAEYNAQKAIETNGLYRAGFIARDSGLASRLSGKGGAVVNFPFWNRPSDDATSIQSATTLDPEKIQAAEMAARRLYFGHAMQSEDLADILSGDDVVSRFYEFSDNYWETQMNLIIMDQIRGVIADDVDDSSDITVDISGESAPNDKLTDTTLRSAEDKLGDAAKKLKMIIMHSKVYNNLKTTNKTDFVPPSDQNPDFETFEGYRVVVSDQVFESGGTYWTILAEDGAIRYGEIPTPYAAEFDRISLQGKSTVITRREFALHPVGFKWMEHTVADEMPTQAELRLAVNWDRVFDVKNCGFVVIKSKG